MRASLQPHTPGYLVITPRRLIEAFTPPAWRFYEHGYRLGMLPGAHNHITFDAPVASVASEAWTRGALAATGELRKVACSVSDLVPRVGFHGSA